MEVNRFKKKKKKSHNPEGEAKKKKKKYDHHFGRKFIGLFSLSDTD